MYCDNLHTAAVELYIYDKQLITMHEVITAICTHKIAPHINVMLSLLQNTS